MKRGTPNHPKMKALARELKMPLPCAVGIMEMLWHFTAEYAPDGGIGRYSDDEIAEACGWPHDRDPGELVQALIGKKWLDLMATCRLFVHDWPEHCEDTVHRKLARGGLKFADGTVPHLSRLKPGERERAEKVYASAPDTDQRAPGAQPDADSCAPDAERSARVCVATPRHATPEPRHATPPAAARGAAELVEWPKSTAAIRSVDPGTDGPFVMAIIQEAARAYADSMGGAGPPLTDEMLSQAVDAAKFNGQSSAGPFRSRVPRVLKTWAEEARRCQPTR